MQWKQILRHEAVPKVDTTAIVNSCLLCKTTESVIACVDRGEWPKSYSRKRWVISQNIHKWVFLRFFFSSSYCLFYAECVLKTIPYTSSQFRRKVSWDCCGVSDGMTRGKPLFNVVFSLSFPIPVIVCGVANLSYHKSMQFPWWKCCLCYAQWGHGREHSPCLSSEICVT